jgi:hypothetical protein
VEVPRLHSRRDRRDHLAAAEHPGLDGVDPDVARHGDDLGRNKGGR